MLIDVYKITYRKPRKQKSGLEHFDHALKNFKYHKIDQVPVEMILESSNISLYLFDFKKKCAIFVEVNNPAELSNAAFFSDYQYRHATKLYLVSLNVFHQLARRIGQPATKISTVAFTARSGSTLLCRAISHAKETFVITEPMTLVVIGQQYDTTTKYGLEFTKNTILFYSWMAAQHGATTLVVKPHVIFLRLLYELFPHHINKNIFIYREPAAVVKSLIQRLPFVQRRLFQTVLKSVIRKTLLDIVPKDVKEDFCLNYPYKQANINEVGTFIWWLRPFEEMVTILQYHADDCLIFSYEEFIATPRENMKKIFTFLDFDKTLLEAALAEFAQDSQRGTVLGRDKKNKLSEAEMQKIEEDVYRFLGKYFSYNQDYNLKNVVIYL